MRIGASRPLHPRLSATLAGSPVVRPFTFRPRPRHFPRATKAAKPVFLWHPRAFEPIAPAGLPEVSVDKMGRNQPEMIRMYAELVLPELDSSAAAGGSSS